MQALEIVFASGDWTSCMLHESTEQAIAKHEEREPQVVNHRCTGAMHLSRVWGLGRDDIYGADDGVVDRHSGDIQRHCENLKQARCNCCKNLEHFLASGILVNLYKIFESSSDGGVRAPASQQALLDSKPILPPRLHAGTFWSCTILVRALIVFRIHPSVRLLTGC